MEKSILQTAERVSQNDASDNFVYARSVLAYQRASEIISGNVLEIGTGSGYGVEIVAPLAREFTTIDKHVPNIDFSKHSNTKFQQLTFPQPAGAQVLKPGYFDYVITFQVIEHIKDVERFLSEVYSLLKPGGSLVVSTPNIEMSLTRNPWHVREYTCEEFKSLLEGHFQKVETYGVFGNDKIMEYYGNNKASVERITRFDPLDLQHRLPRQLLQIPYDILNRMNRKKLLEKGSDLVRSIQPQDYYFAPVSKDCFDLFYIAHKA